MSEELTKDLNRNSTDRLPFEELVKRHLEAIATRLERFEAATQEQLAQVQEPLVQVQEQFVQVRGELGILNNTVAKIEERMTDLDYKLDSFVREQIAMKRDMFKLQEAAGFKQGVGLS